MIANLSLYKCNKSGDDADETLYERCVATKEDWLKHFLFLMSKFETGDGIACEYKDRYMLIYITNKDNNDLIRRNKTSEKSLWKIEICDTTIECDHLFDDGLASACYNLFYKPNERFKKGLTLHLSHKRKILRILEKRLPLFDVYTILNILKFCFLI